MHLDTTATIVIVAIWFGLSLLSFLLMKKVDAMTNPAHGGYWLKYKSKDDLIMVWIGGIVVLPLVILELVKASRKSKTEEQAKAPKVTNMVSKAV